MPPALAFELPAFLLGLLFGSFLNVCISRLPDHRSIVKPRSHCPRCGYTLRWHENLPIISWIFLRGRCSACSAHIPWRYPLVELAMGLWFAIISPYALGNVVGFFGAMPVVTSAFNLISLLALAILGFLLIGLLVMDWQTHTLPDAFTLSGTALGFLLVCVQAIFLAPGEGDVHFNPRNGMRMSSPGSFVARGDVFLTGPEHLVFGRLLAILVAAAIPFLIRAFYKAIRGHEGLGLGDVKLMAMIAAFLGFWPAIFALFLGVMLGAVYGVFLLVRRRADRHTALPLGTFLCIGGLLAALLSEPVIAWYRSLL